MKHLLLKPLLVLCPLKASADAQATKTPTKAQASKTYDANGKLLQKTNDQGQYQGKNHQRW